MNAKPLSNTASARWKRRNKEHVRAKLKRWMIKNQARRRAYVAAYNARNKEYQKAYDAERYLRPENVAKRATLKGQKRLYMQAWLKKHPEAGRIAHVRRTARKCSNGVGDLSVIKNWIKRWRSSSKVSCYWCLGLFRGKDCHSDHIVALSRGGKHSIENMCVACEDCNQRKHNRPIVFWNRLIDQPVLPLDV